MQYGSRIEDAFNKMSPHPAIGEVLFSLATEMQAMNMPAEFAIGLFSELYRALEAFARETGKSVKTPPGQDA
jgi:hypothetical protein